MDKIRPFCHIDFHFLTNHNYHIQTSLNSLLKLEAMNNDQDVTGVKKTTSLRWTETGIE